MHFLYINHSRGDTLYGIELWMLRSGQGLQKRGHKVFGLARPGTAMEKGVHAHGLHPLPYPAKVRELRENLRREKIDIIFVKSYRDLRLAWRASRGLSTKIYIRRGNMRDIQHSLRDLIHIGGSRAQILVPSTALKTEFSRLGWISPRRIHVLHHGVDTEGYPRASTETAVNPSVVFVGRLHTDKGLDVLLHAWKTVLKSHPSARLLLVGDESGDHHKRISQSLGMESSVIFCGYQSDIRPFLARAQLFVLPSRREGAGYVLLEAMACGLPVVASDLPPIREYVADGETGRLIPPVDTERLAQALAGLLADADLRAEMGQRGLKRVGEMFSFDASMARLESLWSPA